MERKELIYRMEKSVDGASFITRIELARFLGYKDPHYVDRYLHGLPRINKKYFIGDVATMLQQAIN
jgi:hypothetical protein